MARQMDIRRLRYAFQQEVRCCGGTEDDMCVPGVRRKRRQRLSTRTWKGLPAYVWVSNANKSTRCPLPAVHLIVWKTKCCSWHVQDRQQVKKTAITVMTKWRGMKGDATELTARDESHSLCV